MTSRLAWLVIAVLLLGATSKLLARRCLLTQRWARPRNSNRRIINPAKVGLSSKQVPVRALIARSQAPRQNRCEAAPCGVRCEVE